MDSGSASESNMDVIDICTSFYLMIFMIKLILQLKILKFKLEYTISAATWAALPDPLYSCEYNCKQYGEDAVKPRAELGLPSHLYLSIDCFMFSNPFYSIFNFIEAEILKAVVFVESLLIKIFPQLSMLKNVFLFRLNIS